VCPGRSVKLQQVLLNVIINAIEASARRREDGIAHHSRTNTYGVSVEVEYSVRLRAGCS